jgi:hypothetical protein
MNFDGLAERFLKGQYTGNFLHKLRFHPGRVGGGEEGEAAEESDISIYMKGAISFSS